MDSNDLPIRERRRRREGSSSDADPLMPVFSARYRSSWPELRHLPLEASRLPIPPALHAISAEINKQSKQILVRRELWDDEQTEIQVTMRQKPNRPETAIPTILIINTWSVRARKTWKGAVQDIVTLGTGMLRKNDNPNLTLHVEMIAPELCLPIHYGPVRNQPSLSQSWDRIRALVKQRLESFNSTRGRMTAIALFRYGLSRHENDNPITIYISVDYSSDETQWEDIIADIKSTVESQGWNDFYVHIEHNIGMHSAFELLPPTGTRFEIKKRGVESNLRITKDYQQTVNLGDDIGPGNYITRSDGIKKGSGVGTLGCYVEIKTTTKPEWTKYALTNYHVIRPAFNGFVLNSAGNETRFGTPRNPSDVWKVDKVGYWPRSSGSPCNFESPSRVKHNYTIWSINDEIQQLTLKQEEEEETARGTKDEEAERYIAEYEATKQALESEKKTKLEFFDRGDQILGEVWTASGFQRKSKDNNRLDWALIKVHKSRQGSNRLPTKDVWTEQYRDVAAHPQRRTFGMSLKEQSKTILLPDQANLFKYTWNVWKVGSSTGVTAGEFHQLKAEVALRDDAHLNVSNSTEYVFQPRSTTRGGVTKFCAPGDSGSVVFDSAGGVVGLFFTGQRPINATDEGFGYVTPIEYVFKDIKDFSIGDGWKEGGITDIRIAVD